MQQICLLTNVSGEQWAAWVQAVGSVVAIAGSFWLARKFQKDEAERFKTQQQAQIELADRNGAREAVRLEAANRKLTAQRCRLILMGLANLKMIAENNATIFDIEGSKDRTELGVALSRAVSKILERSIQGLTQIPLYELPDSDFAEAILSVRHAGNAALELHEFAPQKLQDALKSIAVLCDRATAAGERQLMNSQLT